MSNHRKISSIVDVPKKADAEDLFGISKYEKGLIEFIRSADTPITIAIQGEWGSGKTSLMNTLRHTLCGEADDIRNHSGEFYGIWINTWQYSLMSSKEETLVSIVSSISTQIMNIISVRHEGLGQKALGSVLKLIAKSAKSAASIAMDKVIDGGGDVVAALMEKESSNQTIKNLRDDLQDAIRSCLAKDNAAGKPKKGFLFFIDDLDRIDPPAAVQILELLKNIFDLEHCIFILAIDYDVVVKGLKPKFGDLTVENEREFRSFFDKIIQMPFSMPVASYSINTFLIENLERIGYLSAEKTSNSQLAENFTTFCSLSVGTNPRSLKRLLNTVSLIAIIANEDDGGSAATEDDHRLLLNFALICIQIAYPTLYKALCLESDFRSWNESVARQLKLKVLTELDKQKLQDSEEFDEEWEQVLYRICERDSFLSNRALQVSQLFNLMHKILPEGADLGTTIEELLTLSSVTDVQAFDKPKLAVNKGPVLKSLAKSLLPQLKRNIRLPWKDVQVDSKRIQTNLWLSYRSDTFKDGIGITVEAVKDHLILYVWYHPWAFKIKGGSLSEDVISAGFSKEWETLKSRYNKLSDLSTDIGFKYPPLSKSGVARNWHVPHLTMQFHFPDTETLLQDDQQERIASIVADFMDVNISLRQLFTAYNAKVG